ncbi:MAG TPA: TRSP domain-containing protein, partial [Sphingopyxis sp.]|nr:TRSP domain-containing protein [Sphingopyxis sp.]
AASSNASGAAPAEGMKSRTGLLCPEAARRAPVTAAPGERVIVLGEGEHSYEALLVAEEIERAGGIAAVQCITRSPAMLGRAMASKSTFNDSYGSGAPCFLYNMLGHAPDRVVIVTEVPADQQAEARAALATLGSSVPVDVVACRYAAEESR